MARFLKKKTGLSLGLMFFWGFYFFFSPFLHFHPSDVHAHAGELKPHHHEGHYHSHELEALAHAWNLHPDDEQQDRNQHHSHSSPEHDSDNFEVKIKKAGLQHKNFTEISKYKETFSSLFIPKTPSHRSKEILLIEILPANKPDSLRERAPPYFFA